MKRTCKSLAFKSLFALMLMFSFSINGFGQTVIVPPAEIPERTMEQVVRRILVWSFKPRNQPTEIYLSEKGIKQTWLPKIKNIEFRLLSKEELKQRKGDYYYFSDTAFSDGKYQVGFLLGNKCNARGDNWYFRRSKQKVKIWQSGTIDRACYAVS